MTIPTTQPAIGYTNGAAIVGANSFFKCHVVGNGTVVDVGNWS